MAIPTEPSSATTAAPETPPPTTQPVTEPSGQAAHYIVLNIAPGAAAEDAVRAFFGNAAALTRSVARRLPEQNLNLVVGIGSAAWDRLFGTPRPAGLRPFKELRGAKHHAPATPGDLLLHIRARSVDMCFELAMQAMRALNGAVEPVDEVHGFRYFDARSMVGFVDGTENPAGQEALDATLIGAEDAHFAGGSYVIVQKYLHDMKAWNSLSTEEQERVIGRTKHDDIELPDATKPSNSHVALNVVTDDAGNELAILRGNLPFAMPSRG
ncbi:MAG TPA: Dyp-type peroxidase, partial [Burkholderiaceae bacterium]